MASEDSPLMASRAVDQETGLLREQEGVTVNFEPLPVRKGDVLSLCDRGLEYRTFFYKETPDEKYLYTYAYQPEANWAIFSPEYADTGWKTTETIVPQSGFVRVMLRSKDGSELPTQLWEAVTLLRTTRENSKKPWIHEELTRVLKRAAQAKRDGDAVFLLLTDTHYATGCNWPDTFVSLSKAAGMLSPDGIIHLGDFTDGLLPWEMTARYAGRVLDGLRSLGVPYYGCLGNHDFNYFKKNGQTRRRNECASFYLNRKRPWYVQDLPEQKIRMIFLDTFDPEREKRYGFSEEELRWLDRTLLRTPREYRVLLFSHVPPMASLHVWSAEMLGEETLFRILKRFKTRGGKVLGWIHGHNHADQVTIGPGFPIVSVGCGKTESFPEHKVRGSITYDRPLGEPAQELWDILLLHKDCPDFELIRYGAGMDRHIEPVRRG